MDGGHDGDFLAFVNEVISLHVFEIGGDENFPVPGAEGGVLGVEALEEIGYGDGIGVLDGVGGFLGATGGIAEEGEVEEFYGHGRVCSSMRLRCRIF